MWRARRRAAAGGSMDGCIMGDPIGRRCEVVAPAWWRVDRWWVWAFRTSGYVEFVVHDGEGKPRLHRYRVRLLPPEGLPTLYLNGKRPLAPRALDEEALLRRGTDPALRNVPDEWLEKFDVRRRDSLN